MQTDQEMTLRQAADDFLTTMAVEGYSPRTVELYRAALRKLETFADKHGQPLLRHVTAQLVRGTQADAMKPTPGVVSNFTDGRCTANLIATAARALIRYHRREGINIPELSSIRHIKRHDRVQPRLTMGEFQAIQRVLSARLQRERTPRFLVARDIAIVQVLVETGLRAAEMCALNIGDIDFQEGSILVRRGKGGKDRGLSIVDPDPNEPDGGPTLRAISDYLSYRERLGGALLNPALWLSQKGNRLTPDSLRTVLRALCQDAGIDGNRPPHAFRRAWFTASYEADPNALPVLTARMGWTTPAMAKVYTRGATIDLARTKARPLLSKTWAREAERAEAIAPPPRLTPAAVQRQEGLQALLALIENNPALHETLRALVNDSSADRRAVPRS